MPTTWFGAWSSNRALVILWNRLLKYRPCICGARPALDLNVKCRPYGAGTLDARVTTDRNLRYFDGTLYTTPGVLNLIARRLRRFLHMYISGFMCSSNAPHKRSAGYLCAIAIWLLLHEPVYRLQHDDSIQHLKTQLERMTDRTTRNLCIHILTEVCMGSSVASRCVIIKSPSVIFFNESSEPRALGSLLFDAILQHV